MRLNIAGNSGSKSNNVRWDGGSGDKGRQCGHKFAGLPFIAINSVICVNKRVVLQGAMVGIIWQGSEGNSPLDLSRWRQVFQTAVPHPSTAPWVTLLMRVFNEKTVLFCDSFETIFDFDTDISPLSSWTWESWYLSGKKSKKKAEKEKKVGADIVLRKI